MGLLVRPTYSARSLETRAELGHVQRAQNRNCTSCHFSDREAGGGISTNGCSTFELGRISTILSSKPVPMCVECGSLGT